MSLKFLNDGWFHFVLHRLSAEVLVEHGSSTSDRVLFVLEIIFFEVINKSSPHMRVVFSGAETR